MSIISANPWLMPTPEGLLCRACHGCDTTARKTKAFVTGPLPWARVERNLVTKVAQHLGDDVRKGKQERGTGRVRHPALWAQFCERLRKLLRVPEPAESAERVQALVEAILNTQALLVKINAICSAVAATRPHTLETEQILQILRPQPEICSFLCKRWNLTSRTITSDLLHLMYAETWRSVVTAVRASLSLRYNSCR
jgi:hypothetical protein